MNEITMFFELARNTCLTPECYIEWGVVNEIKKYFLFRRRGNNKLAAISAKNLFKRWKNFYFILPEEYEYFYEYEGIKSLKQYVSCGALTLDKCCDSPLSAKVQEFLLENSGYYQNFYFDYI